MYKPESQKTRESEEQPIRATLYNSLEIKVSIEAKVGILFGLGVCAFAMVSNITEVLMNNSIVKSCVWCGVAFLRSHSGTLPIQMRELHAVKYLPYPRET